jgi:hypothetical protein
MRPVAKRKVFYFDLVVSAKHNDMINIQIFIGNRCCKPLIIRPHLNKNFYLQAPKNF